MINQHVMTLEDPAGLLITPEMLEQIGISTGDQIEISFGERALIVRSLTGAETERRETATSDAEAVADETTVTIRELINGELRARGISSAVGVEVTLADGQKLLIHHSDDPRADEVVKRADVREVRILISGKTSGPTVDDSMESIMDRYDNLFRRLAEGAK